MTIRSIKDRIRNRVWVFLKAKWKLLSGIDIVVGNDSDWFVYNEIFVNKEYDKALQLLLAQADSHALVVDLGANVGYFTLKAADELIQAGKEDFRIVALEAAPGNFSALSRRIRQPLLDGKVKAFLGLAGYRKGAGQVVQSNQHYGHSSQAEPANGNSYRIDYVDIETLLPADATKIHFLKCDIEGSEEIFLAEYPGLLKRVELAAFEFHAGDCDVARCRAMLNEAGLYSMGVIKEDPAFQTSVEFFKRR